MSGAYRGTLFSRGVKPSMLALGELTTYDGEGDGLIPHIRQSSCNDYGQLDDHAHANTKEKLVANDWTQASPDAKGVDQPHTDRCDGPAGHEEWLKHANFTESDGGYEGSKG